MCCLVNVRIRDRVTVVVYPHQIKVGCTLLYKISPPRSYSPISTEILFSAVEIFAARLEFRHFRGFFLGPAALHLPMGANALTAFLFSRGRES